MHSSFSSSVIVAFGLLSVASASPIGARSVCGAAPSGTVAQTPLLQPTGIKTASDCAAQCKGNSACLSFLFGLVDGVDKCILYSVPASSLPPQTNLVAYDIGCTSIPSVVPTTANPGGLRNRQAQGTHDAPVNSKPAGNPTPIAQPVAKDLAACLAACKGNPSCVAYTFTSNQCKLFGPSTARRQNGASTPSQGGSTSNPSTGSSTGGSATTPVGTHDSPINATPAGSPNPIATATVDDLSACLTACKGNPSCVAYTFDSGVCKLFGSTNARRQAQSGGNGASPSNPSSGSGNNGQGGAGSTGTGTGSGSGSTGTGSQVGTHANPMNAVPAGSPSPIATQQVDDLAACLAACKGNSACIAYTFDSGVCKLFN